MTLRGAPPPGTPGPGLPSAPSLAVAENWPDLLRAALGNGPGMGFGPSRLIRIVFQPIVDLEVGTVVGYEALARFTPLERHPGLTTEHWFEAAHVHGFGPELEATALASALGRRGDLPPNCFVSVNLSPDVVAHPAVRSVLASAGDLSNVVIELTEHSRIDSFPAIEPVLEYYRSSGARIAMDDAGAGYSGLQNMVMLKPAIIKLDRSLITGIDVDETRRAMVETVGSFAKRIAARLLGEGVERIEELEALRQLGVPLAQGYLLGRPAARWTSMPAPIAARLRPQRDPIVASVARSAAPVGLDMAIRALLEDVPVVSSADQARAVLGVDFDLDLVVLLDQNHWPASLVTPENASLGLYPPAMALNASTTVAEAAMRAMAREAGIRFQPIVCTDDAGRYVGIVRLERLIERLVRR